MKKRILSLLLSTALVVAAIVNPMISNASTKETGAPTQMEIADYRTEKVTGTDADGNAYEYYTNVPTAPEGYVFAGWYTTEDCTTAVGKGVTDGIYWAKWAKKDVLAVRYQLSASITPNHETTNMRLVTSVDSEKYAAVGFVLNYGTGDSKPAMTKDVYASIKGLVNGQETYYYANKEFDTTSQYFMIYELSNIPKSVFDASINVTPQWETLDGTIVKGTPNTIKVSEKYNENPFYDFENAVTLNEVFAVNDQVSAWNRVSYADAGLTGKDASYGAYALKLSPNNLWPTLTVKNSEKLTQPVKLTLNVYVAASVTGVFGFHTADGATKVLTSNTWEEVTAILPSGKVDDFTSMFNFETPGAVNGKVSAIYIDNIQVKTVDPYTFEDNFDLNSVYVISDQISAWNRVSYAEVGIAAKDASYGDYALKLSPNNCWPMFGLKNSEALAEPIKVTFNIYVASSGDGVYAFNNGVYNSNTWNEIVVTCPAGTTGDLSYMFNFDTPGQLFSRVTGIYVDNIQVKTVEPVNPYTFEEDFDLNSVYVISDQISAWNRISYAEAGIAAKDASYGAYALKLSPNNCWPMFGLKNSEALAEPIKVTFNIYVASSGDGVYAFNNGVYNSNTWNEIVVTCPAGTTGDLSYMFNFDTPGQLFSRVTGIYVDNIQVKTVDPYTFEDNFDLNSVYVISDQISAWNRVSYAEAGIAAKDASYGDYALKLSPNNCWPMFGLKNSEALAEPIKVTFNIYVASSGDGVYAFNNGVYNSNTWNEIVVTCPAGTTGNLSYMFNFDTPGQLFSRVTGIYVDNIQVKTVDPYTFEDDFDLNSVYVISDQISAWNRVSYAEAGITAKDASYGDYALKLSPNNCWPMFGLKNSETLAEPIEVTFNIYVASSGDGVYAFNNGVYNSNTWNEIVVTCPAGTTGDLSYMFNFDTPGQLFSKVTGIYVDNIQVRTVAN